MEETMDAEKWKEDSRKFAKLLSEFKVTNNISNEDIVKLLIRNASQYQSLYNSDENNILYYNDAINDELLNLYTLIENNVIDYIIEHPLILTQIINDRNKQMEDPNWVRPDVYPQTVFSVTIEDIISKLKGNNYQNDLYCGFKVGNKEISIC